MILVVTHVDSKTNIPCTVSPCLNGPILPKINGLKVHWSKTSKNPTTVPEFVGSAPHGDYTKVPGVLEVLTPAQEEEALAQELNARVVKEHTYKAEPIRVNRNRLLGKTDMYMVLDYPISEAKREEWKTYRQQLRDVTMQSNFPDSVEWPVPPNKE
jgi:hypothetical protein